MSGADPVRTWTHSAIAMIQTRKIAMTGIQWACLRSRRPINADDRRSPLYAEGVSCPACYHERTDEQRAGYAERHRQTLLQAARGAEHIGVRPPLHGEKRKGDG